jgi:hypothetical protein
MFGTEIIEVGIGLAFAYFAISIICSGVVEAGVKLTKLRAKHLKQALGELLDDKNYTGFVRDLYDHHLVTSPLKDRLGDPTSISSKNFALAVLDILGKNEKLSNDEQFKLIEARIMTMKNVQMRNKMLGMLNSSAYQVDTMREKVEAWFNESMEAVSEWYRNRMRLWVMLVSIIVVGAMNADTIKMTTMFWNDDELRTATVSAAQGYIDRYDARVANGTAPGLVTTTTIVRDSNGVDSTVVHQPATVAVDTNVVRSIKSTLDTLYQDINATKVLPIGWDSEILPGKPGYVDKKSPLTWWLLKIIGLILTVGAVSLGSTYWYSQLKSLLNLRAGRAPAPDATPTPPPPAPQVTVNLNTPPASAEPKEEPVEEPAEEPAEENNPADATT